MLVAVLVAGLCTAFLMPIWIAIARRHGIHDLPAQRRLHGSTTPRGAGICIALVLGLGIALGHTDFLPGLAMVGVFGFAAIGAWDDLFNPTAATKLALQCVAAVLVAFGLREGWPAAPWFVLAVLGVGSLMSVNLWNFMDGINGLVATQSLLIAIAIAFWPEQGIGLAWCLAWFAGACLGFLPFNIPKASAFLGDAGSYLLGAAVFTGVALSLRDGKFSLPQAFVLCSGILFDSGFTLLQRALQGRNLWRAHREHLYQYAVRRGRSHARVSLMYVLWTLLSIVLAWGMQGLPAAVQWLILVVLGVVAWMTHVSLKQRILASLRHRNPGA